MPQVIVIDEIGTELEAQAARTIAERGVQLIGTAHGNNLDNLMLNPTLSDLIGGIQSVTLGDEEARRRRTQKSVLERKAPPTFDVIVEIQDRERVDGPQRRRRHGRRDAARRSRRAGAALARRGGRPSLAGPAAPVAARAARRGAVRRPRRDWLAVADGARLARRRRRVPLGRRLPRRGSRRHRGPAIGPARPAAGARPAAAPAARPRPRGSNAEGGASGVMPGERFADQPLGPRGGRGGPRGPGGRGPVRRRRHRRSRAARARGTPLSASRRAPARPASSSARRRGATRRRAPSSAMKVEEGTAPVNADDLEADDELDRLPLGTEEGPSGDTLLVPGGSPLPTLRVLPQGISRKRLEQAVRDLQPAGPDRARRRRGRRRHDAQERVQAEDPDAPRRGGPGDADLRPQEQHDARRCRRA